MEDVSRIMTIAVIMNYLVCHEGVVAEERPIILHILTPQAVAYCTNAQQLCWKKNLLISS